MHFRRGGNVSNSRILHIVVLSLSMMASGVFGMSLTDAGKVCLFSGISGVITLDGEPIANARVVRKADRDGEKQDETITDEQGHFSLPPMFERTIAKYLPQEFAASQDITVFHGDQSYSIWRGVKRKPEENTESRGKPLVVACELHAEEKAIIVNNSPIISLCVWDVEPDPKFDGELFSS